MGKAFFEKTPKQERLEYFFNFLKKTNKSFDTAFDAYSHIEQCLEKTEAFHNARSDKMFLLSFRECFFDPHYEIYFRETVGECILVGSSGAYGICKNPKDSQGIRRLQPLEYYKKSKDYLIKVPSRSGKNLFDVSM